MFLFLFLKKFLVTSYIFFRQIDDLRTNQSVFSPSKLDKKIENDHEKSPRIHWFRDKCGILMGNRDNMFENYFIFLFLKYFLVISCIFFRQIDDLRTNKSDFFINNFEMFEILPKLSTTNFSFHRKTPDSSVDLDGINQNLCSKMIEIFSI